MNRVLFFISLLLIIAITGCKTTQPTVSQPEKKDQTLPYGYWNSDDSRSIADKMVKNMMADRWRTEYLNAKKNMRPILIVGVIGEQGSEKVDLALVRKDIEKSIIKSNLVRFVQSSNKIGLLITNLEKDSLNNNLTITSNWASQMGSDFVVIGTINTSSELNRKEKIINYIIKLELIFCETQQPVWIREEKISKRVKFE